MFANVRQCSLKLCYYLYWQKKRKIQSFSPPENERQQGVKALLLVRAQAVPSGCRNCRTLKRPSTLFLKTNNAQRRNLVVYVMVSYCLIKIRSRSPGNHHAIGITAHMDCIVRDSLYPEADKELAALFQVQPLVFRFSYVETYPPIQIFSAKLSVEIQGVLLYHGKRIFYWEDLKW